MLHSYTYSITEKYAVRGGGLYQHLVAHENRLEMGLSAKLPVSRKKRKMNRIEKSTIMIHISRITLHELNIQIRCQTLYDVS